MFFRGDLLIFQHFDCACKSKRVQVPVPPAGYGGSKPGQVGGWVGGSCQCVGQELLQGWEGPSSTELRLEGQFEEGGSERTLRRHSSAAPVLPWPNCGQLLARWRHAHGQGGG